MPGNVINISELEALDEDIYRAQGGKTETTKTLTSYTQSRKSLDWAEAGLSHAAIWTWDVLAAYWRRRHRKFKGRVPIDAEIKRKIAIRHRRDLYRVLAELEAHGLIQVDRGRGRLTRLTFVDISNAAAATSPEEAE